MVELTYDKNRRQVCPLSGGKDSTAMAVFLHNRIPNIEYVFSDTGAELPETYEYLDKIEAFLGKKIIRLNIDKTFDYLMKKHSNYLPSIRARWCTVEMKIKSFERYIGNDLIESYIGIRADEHREGYISSHENIIPRYPFKEFDINFEDVQKILDNSGLGLPKYYQWRSRSGCYFCFFQKKIEWVGLLERHPELFKKAKNYEKMGYAGEGTAFTWIEGYPLEMIERDKQKIKDRHQSRMSQEYKKSKDTTLESVFKKAVQGADPQSGCLICEL